MDELLKGSVIFRQNDFESHRELFNQLKDKQNPHSLFIGCSDSRVVPNLITGTMPGELFMVRNIGNFVPPYRIKEEYLSTTSVIEYAVHILDVKNIIICGHSNCGGCAALYYDEEKFVNIPNVKKWIEIAEPVKKLVLEQLHDTNDFARIEWLTEQINVVEQMKNLLTYPFIAERYIRKKIKIYGWYYIIETGEIYNYNLEKKYFELID